MSYAAPIGRADIAPSRFERVEGDGYHTIDAPWIVPALLNSVPEIKGKVLEPAAGRGHISLELIKAGLKVVSFDVRQYDNPLVPGIFLGDIRKLTSVRGVNWIITNLPYNELDPLAAILTELGACGQCGVALLVRQEWLAPKTRRPLLADHTHFAGVVLLHKRPQWVEGGHSAPRHNFAWSIWGPEARQGSVWLKWA